MANKKIALLGSGSLYFTEVIPDLIAHDELEGSEVTLYDIDSEKSQRMAAMGRRLLAEAGRRLTLRHAATLAEALDGADFALSSIGGSGAEMTRNVYSSYYHTCDIQIPARYGIYQIVGDTGGPAGMMMGLRAIPAYLAVCREMEKRCPKVVYFNHSNPMAVLCRAIRKYTPIAVIGICHGVQIGIRNAAEKLGVPAEELECRWVGTNHYYWFTSVRHRGRDVYPELRRRTVPKAGRRLSARLSAIYGNDIVYPEDDHLWEFYPFAARVSGWDALPYGLDDIVAHWNSPSAAADHRFEPTDEVRREFLAKYQEILDRTALGQEPKSSVLGEAMARKIAAIAAGRREVVVVNIPNGGIVPNLSPSAILEVEAVTDSQGVRGIHQEEAPVALKGILEKRFAWQELVADAGVRGDRNLALQALLLDEMAILPDDGERMLDELLAASRDLLPQFGH